MTMAPSAAQRIPRPQAVLRRAAFDRIRLALESASPPSLAVIATAGGLCNQTMFRLSAGCVGRVGL